MKRLAALISLVAMSCATPVPVPVVAPTSRPESVYPYIYGVRIDLAVTYPNLVDAGSYDRVGPRVNEGFLWIVNRGVYFEGISPLKLEYPATSAAALEKMSTLGLRPADIRELLFFGATFPSYQRTYTVVALGRETNDDSVGLVPYLGMAAEGRILDVAPFTTTWDGNTTFAAIRIRR